MAKAVVPPPDGGYPGFNTAEGEEDALLTSPPELQTLESAGIRSGSNTDGSYNTATGAGALLFNTADNKLPLVLRCF